MSLIKEKLSISSIKFYFYQVYFYKLVSSLIIKNNLHSKENTNYKTVKIKNE